MPTHFFPLTILTQHLDDETFISQALSFPEISRFHTNPDSARQNARINAEMILKADYPPDLYSRVCPRDARIGELEVEVEPPRKTSFWREKIRLKFQFVQIEREDGYFQAYLPALHIGVLSRNEKDFPARIEKEVLATLRRDGWIKSLQYLRWLERVEKISLEKSELAVDLPTARQRAIAEEKEETEEKSVLKEVGDNLREIKLRAAYEREDPVERLGDVFRARQKTSVLLIGPAGVGKTAVFHEMVRRRDQLGLNEFSFWATGGAHLIAGQTGFGMWQERCRKLIEEAKKHNAVLHLGNLIELLEVGKSTASTQGIASFLRPKIARGELVTVVECTPEQIPFIERRDPNLLGAFQQFRIEEPDRKTNLKILSAVAEEVERSLSPNEHKKEVQAIRTIDSVHRRYSTYSAFPGRPIRFLRNLLAETAREEPLSAAGVYRAFAEETGLPEMILNDRIGIDPEEIDHFFSDRVIGQNEAVQLIRDLIVTVKAKLTRPRKPIASLLFIGPTGVGKTEMVKSLAEFFFSDPARMIRFDMSEYSNPVSVQRLIGGTGEKEGLLTARVREQPFSVVLLDEFEKAHHSFFDLLLQMLGEGRLTDSVGRVADFTNSIIVMTSNLGASEFQRGKSGFSRDSRQRKEAVRHFDQAVREFLRPEIFNRLDRIVPFAPLDEKTVLKIASAEIEKLKKRDGLRYRPIRLNISKKVLSFLAETGYDIRYGARPLKRAIERRLLAPLAAELNRRPENQKLAVETDLENGRISLKYVLSEEPKHFRAETGALASNAVRISRLRRRIQKFSTSHRLTELNDEIYRAIRLEALQKRGRWIYEEDQKRIERKPLIERFLKKAEEFADQVNRTEDEILLKIYGKTEGEKQTFAELIENQEKKFQSQLFELLKFQYPQPNEVNLVFFSENAPELFNLLRLFTAVFRQTKTGIKTGLAFTTEKQKNQPIETKLLFDRVVYRKEIQEPEKFFGSARQEICGVFLAIEGDLALPRFGAEIGIHRFQRGGRTNRVLIGSPAGDPGKYVLPDDLTGRDSVRYQSERRFYDLSQNKVKDPLLDKTFSLENNGLEEIFALAVEEHLIRTSENLIG
ncbi:MAG: AAA family ATPase [Pyrinomonadaceae bacterium]